MKQFLKISWRDSFIKGKLRFPLNRLDDWLLKLNLSVYQMSKVGKQITVADYKGSQMIADVAVFRLCCWDNEWSISLNHLVWMGTL